LSVLTDIGCAVQHEDIPLPQFATLGYARELCRYIIKTIDGVQCIIPQVLEFD